MIEISFHNATIIVARIAAPVLAVYAGYLAATAQTSSGVEITAAFALINLLFTYFEWGIMKLRRSK